MKKSTVKKLTALFVSLHLAAATEILRKAQLRHLQKTQMKQLPNLEAQEQGKRWWCTILRLETQKKSQASSQKRQTEIRSS